MTEPESARACWPSPKTCPLHMLHRQTRTCSISSTKQRQRDLSPQKQLQTDRYEDVEALAVENSVLRSTTIMVTSSWNFLLRPIGIDFSWCTGIPATNNRCKYKPQQHFKVPGHGNMARGELHPIIHRVAPCEDPVAPGLHMGGRFCSIRRRPGTTQ